MPVVAEPDPRTLDALLGSMPTGAHGVAATDRLLAWLGRRSEEYVVVLGPGVGLETALATCEELRTTHPMVSPVLVRGELTTAVLTRAMQAGAREVVPAHDPTAVDAAVARAHRLWLALRGPGGGPRRGRVVTVFSPKGGVGKTTMAVNLALALCDSGTRKVCLVDFDFAFGDVAITLQLFPSHSIEQAVGSEETLDRQMLESLLTRHEQSLMVLAAPSQPEVRDRVTPALITAVLDTLREAFDFVVVDTAPSFDEQTLTALDETDECVIVATLDVPTLKNVKVAVETLEMLDVARGHRHLLLNRADDAVGLGPEKVEAILGMGVAVRVSTSIDIAAATNAGQPIVTSKPDHDSSRAIRELAERLAGEPAAPARSGTDPGEDEAAARANRRFRIRR